MPIRIPDILPATGILESENIFVMTEHRALHQHIRPLRVLILNLMPTAIQTETQILRKLSNTPLQVNVDLLQVASAATTTQVEHLEHFYVTLPEIRDKRYDGMVVTGAPVGDLPFEDVEFWPELCEIFDWARSHVFSTLFISWSAQAGMHYYYGIQKHRREEKLLGVFDHTILMPSCQLVRGIDDVITAPRSQQNEMRVADIVAHKDLKVVAASEHAGVYLAKSRDNRHVFVFGHPEYDRDTMAKDYAADLSRGAKPTMPVNYFLEDDPTRTPRSTWRSDGQLLYSNWLNYYVYQATPYDLDSLRITHEFENAFPF